MLCFRISQCRDMLQKSFHDLPYVCVERWFYIDIAMGVRLNVQVHNCKIYLKNNSYISFIYVQKMSDQSTVFSSDSPLIWGRDLRTAL